MAFNPFHGFRKHQKVFFAALAILCMITFVLSGSMSAAWDFYQGIGEIFGFSGGREGSQVATLYGKNVYEPEIRQLRLQREIANLFMGGARSTNQFVRGAVQVAVDNASLYLAEALPKSQLPDFVKKSLEELIQTRNRAFGLSRDPQKAPEENRYFALMQYQQQIQQTSWLNYLSQGLFGTTDKADADLIELMKFVVNQDKALLTGSRPSWYFGGSTSDKDLLDFMIWRHQADQLGIQLSQANTLALVRNETRSQLRQSDFNGLLRDVLGRYRNVSPEDLINALRDEFRVRLAQQALLGSEVQAYSQTKPLITPYEFWTFYGEQRAESTIALLPIAVRQPYFLDKVGQPTEEELKELYERNKNTLYDPASEDAGFMQPARIYLEWVSARPDSPRFQRAAESVLAAAQATMPLAYEAELLSEYDNEKWWFRSPTWFSDTVSLFDAKVNRPEAIVAGIGQAASLGTQGPAALAGWVGYGGVAVGLDVQARLPERMRAAATVSAGMLCAGASATPFPAAALVAASAPATEYLPLERIKTFVRGKERDKLARNLVKQALESLREELASLARKQPSEVRQVHDVPLLASQVGLALGSVGATSAGPRLEFMAQALYERLAATQEVEDLRPLAGAMLMAATSGPSSFTAAALFYDQENVVTAAARKAVAKAIDRYALEHGATLEPRDQFELGKDPQLARLKKALNRPWPISEQSEGDDQKFGADVFKRVEHSPLYGPQQTSEPSTGEEFLYWKTGEKAKYVPTFAEAKDKVRARWLFEKARPLAQQEADKVAQSIPKNTTGLDAERILRDAPHPPAGQVFELDRVARLVMPRTAVASRNQTGAFEPYKVPEGKIEYSSTELVDKLLSLKEQGEAVVVHDRPKGHYYVGVLVHRSPAYENMFAQDAARGASLLDWYEKDTQLREKHLQASLKQLREDAGLNFLKAETKTGESPAPLEQE
jgi:hypothetical protein